MNLFHIKNFYLQKLLILFNVGSYYAKLIELNFIKTKVGYKTLACVNSEPIPDIIEPEIWHTFSFICGIGLVPK